ncbi:MAG: hypothetical protein ACO3NZ_15420 [Pirellulales bacterium]|jgi:hypothetical protein
MSVPAPTAKQPAELNELVAAIAADVLRRLAPASVLPASASPQAVTTSVAEERGPLLSDKVVALAAVSKLPSDLTAVTVRHDAVLTPSAREWLRDHKVRVHRATAAAANSGAVATAPAFLVAAYDLPSRPAGQAATIVRAVPNGQHLPSAGLAAIVDAFAEGASRSGSRGMLLASRPAAAALIANRKRAVRAVAASSVAEALAVATECRATLLVVDPRRFATGGLQRLAIEFAKQTHGELPADLAEASRPCGCSRSSKEATA